MATVVALDCTDGALLAGDRQVVEDGTVVGTRRHVFALDDEGGADAGAAAVGDDPDAFRRRLDAEIREYRAGGGDPSIDALARMAAAAADETGVEALVGARDDGRRGRVRSVSGGVLDERLAARGTAAATLLGHLETVGETGLDEAEPAVREAFEAATARDPGTGDEIDVWRLDDARSGETV